MTQTQPQFYTQNGWVGSKYQETKHLSTPEIAKLIRREIKKKFPNIKVSIRSKYFSGSSSITCTIKDLPFNPINPEYDPAKPVHLIGYNCRYTKQYIDLVKEIEKIGDQYRFDDCDPGIDYFHVNFYWSVQLAWEAEKRFLEEKGIKIF